MTLSEFDRPAQVEAEQPATPRRRRTQRYAQSPEAEKPQSAESPLFQTTVPAPARPLNPDLAPLHTPAEWAAAEKTEANDSSLQGMFAPKAQTGSAETPRPQDTGLKLDFTPTRRPAARNVPLNETTFAPSEQTREALQNREPVAESHHVHDDPPRRGRLIALIAILLILALLVGGYFLIPDSAGGVLGRYKQLVNRFLPASAKPAAVSTEAPSTAEVLGFNGAPVSGRAPTVVVFSVTTGTGVEDVRLCAEDGAALESSVSLIGSEGGQNNWLISLPVPMPMTARVTLQYNNGTEWLTYDQYLNLSFE